MNGPEVAAVIAKARRNKLVLMARDVLVKYAEFQAAETAFNSARFVYRSACRELSRETSGGDGVVIVDGRAVVAEYNSETNFQHRSMSVEAADPQVISLGEKK